MNNLNVNKVFITSDNSNSDEDLYFSYYTGKSACLTIADNEVRESVDIDSRDFLLFVQSFLMHYNKFSVLSTNTDVEQIKIQLPRSSRNCLMDMRRRECIFKLDDTDDYSEQRGNQVRVSFFTMEKVLRTLNTLI